MKKFNINFSHQQILHDFHIKNSLSKDLNQNPLQQKFQKQESKKNLKTQKPKIQSSPSNQSSKCNQENSPLQINRLKENKPNLKTIKEKQQLLKPVQVKTENQTKTKLMHFVENQYKYGKKNKSKQTNNDIHSVDLEQPQNTQSSQSNLSLYQFLQSSNDEPELGKKNPREYRKQEITKLQQKLGIVSNSNEQAINQLNQSAEDINNFYNQQIQQTFHFFEYFELFIAQQKQHISEQLQIISEATVTKIQEFVSQLNTLKVSMENINSDINQHKENIIQNMENKPFGIILSKYHENLNCYELALKSLENEELVIKKVMFEFPAAQKQQLNNNRNNSQQLSQIVSYIKQLLSSSITVHTNNAKVLENTQNLLKLSQNSNVKTDESFKVSFENKEMFYNQIESQKKSNLNYLKTEQNEEDVRKINLITPKTASKCRECHSVPPQDQKRDGSYDKNKFINLLNKITSNQQKQNTFYDEIMKKKSKAMHCKIDSENSQTSLYQDYTTIRHEDLTNQEILNPQQLTTTSRELKKFTTFFNYIENQLNDEKHFEQNNSYQKTLFFSPHFKTPENNSHKDQHL